jgi:hypothetical protein
MHTRTSQQDLNLKIHLLAYQVRFLRQDDVGLKINLHQTHCSECFIPYTDGTCRIFFESLY